MDDGTSTPRPPALARRLLSMLLRREPAADVLASLDELYRIRADRAGRLRARLWYWRQTAGFVVRWPWTHATSTVGAGALGELLRDLRFAARGIRRSPAFAAVVVLTAGFGIALATLVFTVLNASMLRPLPHVRNPDELVKLSREMPSQAGRRYNFSYDDFETLRERAATVQDVVAVVRWVELLMRAGSDQDRQVIGAEVSENYFQTLGIPMSLGRGILPGDAASGGHVAVLGHTRWQRDFGGRADALGSTVRIDGQAHTVVGVAPRGLGWLNHEPVEAAVFIPLRSERRARGAGNPLYLAARRASGVTVAQVQAELDAIAHGMAEADPEGWTDRSGEQIRVRVMTDLQSRLDLGGGRAVSSLVMYFVLVSMIMLITCSNVANLLLTRALGRRAEIAVRLALGSGRARLVRQLLCESVLLFLMAGALGLLVIQWVTGLVAVGWGPLPAAADVTVDGRVTVFTVALAVASGLVFGLAPALQATRTDLASALKGTGRAKHFRRFGIRNLFVVGQVAGSMVLVAVSAILVRDIQVADTLDPGFDADGVTVLSLNLAHGDYDAERRRHFLDELTERIGRTPGVEAVAVSSWVPMSGDRWTSSLVPEGHEVASEETPWAVFNAVTPGFFELIRIPLLAGRDFTAADDEGAPAVALVNEAFVSRFWPGEAAVGRTVLLGGGDTPVEVVGVARDARYSRADFADAGTSPHIWLPRAQVNHHVTKVHVRSSGDEASLAASMRRDLRLLDADLPIVELTTLRNIADRALLEERLAAAMMAGFGAAALLLAILGIYGVLAFAVMDRAKELGVRLAVGGGPGRIVAMVVAQSVRVSSLGILAGLVVSVMVALGMRTLLIGSGPLDPVSLGGSVLLLLLAAVVASLVPALRAAGTDPVQSLRSE